jgi:hypothetical protein
MWTTRSTALKIIEMIILGKVSLLVGFDGEAFHFVLESLPVLEY